VEGAGDNVAQFFGYIRSAAIRTDRIMEAEQHCRGRMNCGGGGGDGLQFM